MKRIYDKDVQCQAERADGKQCTRFATWMLDSVEANRFGVSRADIALCGNHVWPTKGISLYMPRDDNLAELRAAHAQSIQRQPS